jgi:hypothetical protein
VHYTEIQFQQLLDNAIDSSPSFAVAAMSGVVAPSSAAAGGGGGGGGAAKVGGNWSLVGQQRNSLGSFGASKRNISIGQLSSGGSGFGGQQIGNDLNMDNDFEFTDLEMNDELEEWMNLMGEGKKDPFATMF